MWSRKNFNMRSSYTCREKNMNDAKCTYLHSSNIQFHTVWYFTIRAILKEGKGKVMKEDIVKQIDLIAQQVRL